MEPARAELLDLIRKSVLVRANEGAHIAAGGAGRQQWLFDFRMKLLNARFLELAADLFWDTFKDRYPFQVGGLETASLPLITAIVLTGEKRGTPVNGFYIRKSRKPEGLQKIVEGTVMDAPIILVDDLINNGNTFLKQLHILEHEKHPKPIALFALLRFRDLSAYAFANDAEINIVTPFTLEDFGLPLETAAKLAAYDRFSVSWRYHGPHPNYFHRLPKSAPAIDADRVYFGTDDGYMRALRQEDGSEVWAFRIYGFGTDGKTIFSSPAIHDGLLYFGAYDGNFYALDAQTGEKKWMYMDADWIGSSPCVASDSGLVYVGLEYGLWKKQGGVVALDAKTGAKRWEYIDIPAFTHCSPAYSKKSNVIVIGGNDGIVYCFHADTGQLLWRTQVGGEVKSSLAFDEKRGYVMFGSFDQNFYVLNIKDGSCALNLLTGAAIYSTPLVYEDRAYVSSLDKRIYCVNLDTFDVEWTFETQGRIFASPAMAGGMLYIGSNDGRLYELDPRTGRNTAFFQAAERITNRIAYQETTGRLFLPTYANELYCLQKKDRL